MAVKYFDTVISTILLKFINLSVWVMPYLREVVFQLNVSLFTNLFHADLTNTDCGQVQSEYNYDTFQN